MIFKKSLMFCVLLSVAALYSCSNKDDDNDPVPEVDPPVNGGSGWDIKTFRGSVYDVQFVNATTGYFVGDSVYKTTDAGKTWVPTNTPPKTGDMGYNYASFVDENNGWVIFGKGSHFIRTTDGGNNWLKSDFYGNIAPVTELYNIKFTDLNTGYIMGNYGLLKTTNAGASWDIVYKPDNNTYNGPALFFIDNKTGWLSEFGGIARTTDGVNFTKVNVGEENSRFFSFHFLNKLEGFALQSNGQIWQTDDGGVTWSKKIKVNVGDTAHDLFFIDKNTGYVSGKGGVAKIADNKIEYVIQDRDCNAWEMYFLNKDHGFVGSAAYKMYRLNAPK